MPMVLRTSSVLENPLAIHRPLTKENNIFYPFTINHCICLPLTNRQENYKTKCLECEFYQFVTGLRKRKTFGLLCKRKNYEKIVLAPLTEAESE